MPTKASKSSKAKPTAADVLLSKIKPTKSKPTAAPAKNGNGKTGAVKKANGNAKATTGAKPTPQVKVNGNGNGKVVAEKKAPVTSKASSNGKVTTEKKANGNGKTATDVKAKGNSNGGAKANGNHKTTTKIQTTVVKATKAPKPTKASKPGPTKSAATKAPKVKTQSKADVKDVKAVTKVPPVSKRGNNFVRDSPPTKSVATSAPVRPTPARPTRVNKVPDIKSHKPFPPFGNTALSGTGVPPKKVTNRYQQVQQEADVWVGTARVVCPIFPISFPDLSIIQDLQQKFYETSFFSCFLLWILWTFSNFDANPRWCKIWPSEWKLVHTKLSVHISYDLHDHTSFHIWYGTAVQREAWLIERFHCSLLHSYLQAAETGCQNINALQPSVSFFPGKPLTYGSNEWAWIAMAHKCNTYYHILHTCNTSDLPVTLCSLCFGCFLRTCVFSLISVSLSAVIFCISCELSSFTELSIMLCLKSEFQ